MSGYFVTTLLRVINVTLLQILVLPFRFSDIVNVMSGMSDKISNFLQNFTVFVVAFIMALATNWRLSLAAFSLVPFIAASVLCAVIVSE